MTRVRTLSLRVLDIDLSLDSDDHALLDFLAQLWSPFIRGSAADGAPSCSFTTSSVGWIVQAGDREPEALDDPWLVALGLRTWIDEVVVASFPRAVDLHGVVAEVAGRSILFPGDPGAGKTTLLLAALERGWALVSDDLSLMDLDTAMVRVLPRPIGIRAGVPLADFSHRWTPPPWVPPPRRAYLVPADVYPRSTDRAVSIAGVVFPTFKPGSATLLTEIPPAQALARLGRHVTPLVPPAMTLLSALCARVPAAALEYGDPGLGVHRVIETFGPLSL